jgi:hypothetical protein
MLRQARTLFLVFFAAALLAACSKTSDNARYIPADAVAVVGINLKSLSKKIAWNLITGSKLFKEIQKRMAAENAADAVGGIENAGFDVSNTFYVYTKPDSRFLGGNMVAGLVPLADVAAWEAYVKKVFPKANVATRNGRKETMLGDGMYIGWTSEILIILNANTATSEELNVNGTLADETIIAAEMDKIFQTPAGNNIVNNKRFAGFSKQNYDLSFWLNYGSLISNYAENSSADFNGISLSSATWKDAVLTTGFDFKKGKIAGDICYYMPSQMQDAAKDFGTDNADKDMIARLPKDNMDMLLSMHISPVGVKSMLEKTGLFGITNVGLSAQGMDVDYVLNAFTGDMAIVMNNLSLRAEHKQDEFMGQMVNHKQQKATMNMTYVVKINNTENFNKLLDMTAGMAMQKSGNDYVMALTEKDSVYLKRNKEYAVITNKNAYASGMLNGSYKNDKMPEDISGKATQNPFAMYIDIKQLFKDVDPAISSSRKDSAVIAESKKLLDNISITGGKYADQAYKFSMEINFMNKDENSILEIIDFGMRMNDINN